MEKLTAADASKYWGCQVRGTDARNLETPFERGILYEVAETKITISTPTGLCEFMPFECQLELRPLSKITDEDAIEVAKMINSHEPYSYCLHYDASLVKKGYEFGSNKNSSLWNYDIIDYLRSRSYDCDNFISQGKAIEL